MTKQIVTAHTPGPWRAVMDGVKVGRYNVCPHVTAGGSSKGMIDEREIAYANARLIAAAPELLAASEAALGIMNLMGWDGDPVAENLRAAIAKATKVRP